LQATYQAAIKPIFWAQGLLELRHCYGDGAYTKQAQKTKRHTSSTSVQYFPPHNHALDSILQRTIPVYGSMETFTRKGDQQDQQLAVAFQLVALLYRHLSIQTRRHDHVPQIPGLWPFLRHEKQRSKKFTQKMAISKEVSMR